MVGIIFKIILEEYFSDENNIGIPMTKDHKPNLVEERNRINEIIKMYPEEDVSIELDENEYRIKDLSLSRAFGDLDAIPYVTHIPQLYHYALSNKKFMILACDGLWDVIDNQDAVDFVSQYYDTIKSKSKNNIFFSKSKRKDNIAYMLGKYAFDNQIYDNITIIIVFF